MRTKRDIEFAALIKAAESVETGAVQVVEELGGDGAQRVSIPDELIETGAVAIESLLAVLHFDRDLEAAPQLRVKVYQVGVDVVEQRARWSQTERGR